MEALIAKAGSIPSKKRKRESLHHPHKGNQKSAPPPDDATLASISTRTRIPKSLRPSSTLDTGNENAHIPSLRLRTHLTRLSAQTNQAKALLEDAARLLPHDEAGGIEVEGEMERTWRIGQEDIVREVGGEVARVGRREVKLDGGSYRVRYSRNGRHLAIVGRTGHAATFDWQTGTVHSELQLQETCRDITFLHDHSHYAIAQAKHVYIYDRDGVELHRLKNLIDIHRLEFLPYHWLLTSIGSPGILHYLDTTTGTTVISHRTHLGACSTMAQNPHTAVVYLGHVAGSLTLWTPNQPKPVVQVLTHLGGVTGVSVDPSEEGGRYVATAGRDGSVKVWDARNWGKTVRVWDVKGAFGGGGGGSMAASKGPGEVDVEWSQRGYLAVSEGGRVNIYAPPAIHTIHHYPAAPPLYLTHPLPHARPLSSIRFAPFQDVLTIGHGKGVSSILVPGAGEPNFDSAEADMYEGKKGRREREVRGLLDKIPADMISLDPEFIGKMVPETRMTTMATKARDLLPSLGKMEDINRKRQEVPFARLPRLERLRVQGKADESEVGGGAAVDEEGNDDDGELEGVKKREKEEEEKKRMRGRGKSVKRYLRKQRKNVIDPTAVAIRAKLLKQRESRQRTRQGVDGDGDEDGKKSALDRFKRKAKAS